MSSILVGLDLSPSSRAALLWAAQQARLTGRRLLAVNAVPIPASLASVGIMGTPESAVEESNIDVAHREAISAVWDSVRPGLGWTLEFVLDDAGRALVARSAEAALLVVGTHEHVGLARLVSGSVSRYCLSHAKCRPLSCPSTIAQSLQATRATDRRAAKLRCCLYPCVRRRPGAQNETRKPSCD
jgi:nucleotide-binding universal stress UspA family protein